MIVIITAMNKKLFQEEIWTYYKNHGRILPWRSTHDSYKIFVSEIMLQQTQVSRVLKKYPEFIKAFPTFKTLADAKLSDVFFVWRGMGYNRRAKFMKQTAEIIIRNFNGTIPNDLNILTKFPGIGLGTAGSLIAFIYNEPVCFVETNIRRVIIHFFFKKKYDVQERDIIKKVQETIDTSNPREWYYALMDYGSMLPKQERINVNIKSKIYKKQTPFAGSGRQLRGLIIQFLLDNTKGSGSDIARVCRYTKKDINKILAVLIKEKLIKKNGAVYSIFEE